MKDNIQQSLLQLIELKSMGSNLSMADILCDLLGISKDSAYRRIRCETIFNLEELSIIAGHYGISVDELFAVQTNRVLFSYNTMKNVEDYRQYLKSILQHLKLLLKSSEDCKIIYAAQDIPIFHNFRTANLSRFKLFYWLRTIVNTPETQGKHYQKELIDTDLIELGEEIFSLYGRIPSDEIWTEVTPISLFKQIEFCWAAGIFKSKEDALQICFEAEEEFKSLEYQARTGIKTDNKGNHTNNNRNYNLYWSDIEIGNNCILTHMGKQQKAFLAYNTFNKISTANNAFCNDIGDWLNNLMRKSTLISEVSEKHRFVFFKKLYKGIEDIRKKIELD